MRRYTSVLLWVPSRLSELVASYSTMRHEVVSEYSARDQQLVNGYKATCMPSAWNQSGTCSASKEVWQDVNDTSPIIDDGEKVEKRSKISAVFTQSAEVPQIVGSVPADCGRLVVEALPTFQNLKNSAD